VSANVVTKREIVTCTNRVADAFTITRSADYCPVSDAATTQTNTAQSFLTGDIISHRMTAKVVDDLNAELVRLEADKLNVTDYQNGTKVYAASSGGTDAYAITLSPALGAYATGQSFLFQADVGNTGTASLNINGLGAKTILKLHDTALVTGDIEAGQIVQVAYDGTNFQMNSQISSIPTIDINGQTTKSSLEDDDQLIIYDTTGGANKKIAGDILKSQNNIGKLFTLNENMTAGDVAWVDETGKINTFD